MSNLNKGTKPIPAFGSHLISPRIEESNNW